MRRHLLGLRPPRIAGFLLIVAALLYGLRPPLRHHWWFLPGAAALTFSAGCGIMLWAWLLFRRRQNPVCPTARAVTFIRSGPYRLSRNPMYLGMLLMLLAVFVWLGSPVFLAPPLLFFLILQLVFIPFEEERLAQVFPEEFPAFLSHTRRWL